jgi:D-alanyl-D-alanine carboxypeptidase
MGEVLFRKHQKDIFRKKRARHFRNTASFMFLLAMLAAIAYGLLGHCGVSDDQFTPPPTTTVVENSFQGASSTRSNAGDNSKTAWSLILINKWNPIPNDYHVDLTYLSNGQSVDTRIYPELQEMFDVARNDGVYLVVAEGYRTAQKQQSLLGEKIAELKAAGRSAADAKKEAEKWVAIPGTSEHQIGIAVDINADGIHSPGSKVYAWLGKNAWKYGFIPRYPSDKTDITGVSYEPWHYRYVGKEAAEQICRQSLCLEEYLKAMR